MRARAVRSSGSLPRPRSEEHTSELQSQSNLVCRLLLEKKKHIKLAPPIGCSTRRHKQILLAPFVSIINHTTLFTTNHTTNIGNMYPSLIRHLMKRLKSL